jgi:hypothetical protein
MTSGMWVGALGVVVGLMATLSDNPKVFILSSLVAMFMLGWGARSVGDWNPGKAVEKK